MIFNYKKNNKEYMRCAYYCCGDGYNLQEISKYYADIGSTVKLHEPEILYVRLQSSEEQNSTDMFIFSYGCITFWGLDPKSERDIIDSISAFSLDKHKIFVHDSCSYQITGRETLIDEEKDLISLESNEPYIKLSLSYGLSQSVKLAHFENSVDKAIDNTKHIPNDIIKTGRISFSRKALAIKIGELFAERNLINLHSTILDTPEFFWRRPKYQPYYEMSIEFMDISTRLNILNKRLDVINELYGMLSNELQHLHTSRLELIIIFLILIEVVIVVFRDLLNWI